MAQGTILILLTFLAKVAGFCRDLVLSYFYGASNIVEAYVVATTIPMVIFSFVGTGIQTSMIPMLNRVENGENDVNEFVSNCMNVFAVFCFVAMVIVILFTKPVINLFASGFDEETMQIAISFTRFSIIGIVFSMLVYIYTSILQYNKRFIAAAFSIILMDGVVLLFVVLSHFFGIKLLPIGNVIAFFTQAFFLRCFSRCHHSWRINFNDKYLKIMIQTIIPVIIGTSVNQINRVIDQTLASHVLKGGIAYLNYGNRVLGVIEGVVVLTFISYIFPRMPEFVHQANYEKLFEKVKSWLIILEFVIVPCTILFCVYSDNIIDLLFLRGAFNQLDALYTSEVLFYYSLMLPMYAVRELISRVFYANGDTKLPMINSAVGVAINVVLSIVLAFTIGFKGLPIGTTVACIITAITMCIHYCNRFGSVSLIQLIKVVGGNTIHFFVVSGVCICISKFVPVVSALGQIGFLINMLIAVCLYFIYFVAVLKIKPSWKQYFKL